MFNKMKLQSQMMLVSIICAMSLVFMTIYALNQIGHVQSLDTKYDEQRKLAHYSEQAQKSLFQMMIQENKFIQTGEMFFAEKFGDYKKQLISEIKNISTMDQNSDFTKIKEGLNNLDQQFTEVINAREGLGYIEMGKSRNDYDGSIDEYVDAKVKLEQNQLSFNSIMNDLEKSLYVLSYNYEKDIQHLMVASKQARLDLQYNLIIAMVVALLIVLFCGAVVTTNLSNHYEFTMAYLQKLAKGDYEFKIRGSSEENELGAISRKLKTVKSRLEELDDPKPIEGALRDKIFENTNVVDLQKKRLERERSNQIEGRIPTKQ